MLSLDKKYFQRLIESSPDIIIAVDKSGIVNYYNDGARTSLGYSSEEIIGDAAKASELKDYVKSQLAPYKYPRDVRFTDALPRSATGKLQHFRLRAQVEAEAGAAAAADTHAGRPAGDLPAGA